MKKNYSMKIVINTAVAETVWRQLYEDKERWEVFPMFTIKVRDSESSQFFVDKKPDGFHLEEWWFERTTGRHGYQVEAENFEELGVFKTKKQVVNFLFNERAFEVTAEQMEAAIQKFQETE